MIRFWKRLGWITPVVLVIAGYGSSAKLSGRLHEATEDERGFIWKQLSRGSKPGTGVPTAGEDGQIVYDSQDNRFIFYGGKNDTDTTMAETWFFYPKANRWEKLTASAQMPAAKEDHVLVYDSHRHKAILHGGEDGDTTNDLWELDLATLQWENFTSKQSPHLEDHAAVFVPEQKGMFTFGGQNEHIAGMNDIWFLDLDPQSKTYRQWRRLPSDQEDDHQPSPRVDAHMTYDAARNRLLVYGGWNKVEDRFTNDTWEFLLETACWKKLGPQKRQSHPPERRHFGSALDTGNGYWIIFGGSGTSSQLNDLWGFDLQRNVWVNLTPGPPARMDLQMLYNTSSGEIFLYGGDRHVFRDRHKLHDMWKIKLDREPYSSAKVD